MDENKNIPLNDNSASQENNPAKPLPSQQPKGADLEKMVREMFDGPEQKSTASTNKNSLFAKTVTEPKSDSFFKQFILPKFHLSFGKKNPVVTGLDIGTSAIKCVTFACEPTGPEFISMD
ncbi:MAG: hypothetical protein NTY47_06450, partial [Candidatus Omnitrophica bacterium]|nr:hypothetical protein [Candidatus Omnitrophota bacterium]